MTEDFSVVNNLIKASIAQSYEIGIGGTGIQSADFIAPPYPISISEGQRGVNYINPATKENIQNNKSNSSKVPTDSAPVNTLAWDVDIAQSHHFTIQINNLKAAYDKGSKNLLSYQVSSSPFGKFLPVKTMTLTYSGYETMALPFSAFADFPILQRKRVPIVNLVCYDEDTSELERNLIEWNNECFPQGKYVAYMDDVIKELVYIGYRVDGVESFRERLYVIPIGQPQVNRSYEENDAKLITFSLVCVGNGNVCATGAATQTREAPANTGGSGSGGRSGSGGGNKSKKQTNKNLIKSISSNSNEKFIGNETPNSQSQPTPTQSQPTLFSVATAAATRMFINAATLGNFRGYSK